MKTEICKEKYAASMCSMAASSEEQNRSLQRDLKNQMLSLKQCYVMLHDEQVIARAVIDTERSYIAYLTLEAMSQKEADAFVEDIVDRLDRSREWRVDLYTDKQHHALVYHALKRWFPLEFKRESYTVKTREQAQAYRFIPAKQLAHRDLLELMAKASATTLDANLQREQKSLGLYPAVEQQAEELLEDAESDILFQVLLIAGKAAGFISVTRLLDEVGGIGYIGVHPDVQGRQYGTVLLKKAMDMIGWKEKGLRRDMGDKVRGLGVALSMQGSGIANVDIASTVIKLQDDGFYTLSIGATDMGTGCDTILAQMAAECLDCDVDKIITQAVDTDASPYDTGSYASATTYVTGMAVVKTCEELRKQIIREAAVLLEVDAEHITFDGESIYALEDGKEMMLADFANRCFAGGRGECLIASASHCSPTSPPPFMAGIAEVDVDKLTGEITMVDYVAVVDCGTIINPNLARIQTEGGIAQGIGMALYEDITYSPKGRMRNSSFLQYKIPTRQDVGEIRVDFESSYEDNGPFGAKSIGEVVINTPAPAIASAVAHASGVQVRTLPITAEKVLLNKDED